MQSCRDEFAATCFPCVAEVLEKTGIKATDINFVVRGVCCWGLGGWLLTGWWYLVL